MPEGGARLDARTLLTLAVGALGGALLVALVAIVVWPDDADRAADRSAATVPTAVVATPAAPASQPTGPVQPAATATANSDDQDEDDEDDDQDEEPSEAALVAGVAPAGEGPLPDSSPVTCPAPTVTVSGSDELESALAAAAPGTTISLQAGTYAGQFTATTSGTAAQPVFLCGSPDAVLDGGDVEENGYTFHLDGASSWRLVGFTIRGGQKGLVADTTVGSVIQDLTITGTGDEAVHLRTNSTDNVVRGNTISGTGLSNDKYGEGVYLGSAVSNWCTYTDCQPDRSDRNVVIANTITDTTAEAVDVKEGTTGGVVADNTFDGSSLSGADSWVDIKGNNYLVSGNTGTSSEEDGFQTHQILDGWGDHNLFTGNVADVGGAGHAISSQPPESNVVRCDNTVVDADEGLSNIDCTS